MEHDGPRFSGQSENIASFFNYLIDSAEKIAKTGNLKKGETMYKLEISANSPEELHEKIIKHAEHALNVGESRDAAPKPQEVMYPNPAVPTTTDSLWKPSLPAAKPLNFPNQQVSTVSPAFPTVQPVSSAPQSHPVRSTATGSVDSRGFTWDERIHSSSKEKIADGSWRKKRGVDPTQVAQVEGELRGVQPMISQVPVIPLFPTTVPTPTPITSPALTTPPNDFSQRLLDAGRSGGHPAMVQEVKTQYDEVQVPGGTRPAHTLNTFKIKFNETVAVLITEGKITQEWIAEVCQYLQIKNIWNVLADDVKLQQIYDSFVQHGFITAVEG